MFAKFLVLLFVAIVAIATSNDDQDNDCCHGWNDALDLRSVSLDQGNYAIGNVYTESVVRVYIPGEPVYVSSTRENTGLFAEVSVLSISIVLTKATC